jgi:hypothetical protein
MDCAQVPGMCDLIIRSAARENYPDIVRMIRSLAAHVDNRVSPKTTVETLEQEGLFGKGRFQISEHRAFN